MSQRSLQKKMADCDLCDLPDLILDIDDVTNDMTEQTRHIGIADIRNLNNLPVDAQIVDSFQETYVDTNNFKEHLRGIFKATTSLPSDTMISHLSHRSAFPPKNNIRPAR